MRSITIDLAGDEGGVRVAAGFACIALTFEQLEQVGLQADQLAVEATIGRRQTVRRVRRALTGALQSSAFDATCHGSHVDSSNCILYNSQTGDLFFDHDGSGTAHQAMRFANIANHASVSASDFLIA
jgi:hypothetical protein